MAARKDSDKIALVSKSGGGCATNRMYVLTQEQKEEIGRLAGYMSNEQMADYFGIERNTLKAIRDRDAEVDRLYLKGRAQKLMTYAEALEGKALGSNPIGDTAAIAFYLKTKGNYRTADSIEQVAAGNTEKYYPPEIREKYARMIELDKICTFLDVDEVRDAIKQYKINKK
jgi:hypothetical protein